MHSENNTNCHVLMCLLQSLSMTQICRPLYVAYVCSNLDEARTEHQLNCILLLMDRVAKLRKLENKRRQLPHASAAFFSAVLKAVKDDPTLAEGPSRRQDFRKARDAVVLEDTSFGPMLVIVQASRADNTLVDLYAAHPFATLEYAILNNPRFKAFFERRLRAVPCTQEKPWHIILYSDEVTPGNVHAPLNKRKFQAAYWSFLEFGSAALSYEEYWFPLLAEFSQNVKELSGGMSQVFVVLCKLFFEPGGFNVHPSKGGINLQPIEARFFAVMGVILQDGGAHKSVWHSRDGSKVCLLCKNLFTIDSKLSDEDDTGMLCCGVINLTELKAETSMDLRNKARYLEYHRNSRGFKELEQSLGVTYHPKMFLVDRYLDDYVDVVDVFFTDWMHAFFVDGIFNLMLYLLFEAFLPRPIYATFRDFLQSWVWPAKVRRTGPNMAEIFCKERVTSSRKAMHIKCQASDGWSLLQPLQVFTTQVLLALGTSDDECNVFLAMLEMIDIIASTPKCKTDPSTVLAAVHKFLDQYVKVFGFEWTTPKFHWPLHFAEFLQKMHEMFADTADEWGWLPNCFALERKHKLGKRYATERSNTTHMKSGGLLSEVLCQHVSDMQNAPAFELGLVNGHKATKAVKAKVVRTLELPPDTVVHVSRSSWHSSTSYSSTGDFVLFKEKDDISVRAGKVQLHFEVAGINVSIIELFELVSRRNNYLTWKPVANVDWLETEFILDCVIYNQLPDGKVSCFLPFELR